jgi:hypothetical protein
VLGDGDLDAVRVLAEVIPPWRRDMHVPVFKYLRAANLMEADGTLGDGDVVDPRVADRVAERHSRLLPPAGYHRARAEAITASARDFDALATNYEPHEVFMSVALLADEAIDPALLRQYLIEDRESQVEKGHALQATQWMKAVCLYDWLRYGRQT